MENLEDLFDMGSYKEVELFDDHVIITHYLREEYNDHDFVKSYTFTKFKNEMLENYNMGVQLGWTEIIEDKGDIIVSKMPKYDILLDNLDRFDMDKLIALVKKMSELKIYHDDFAFRNIGIDSKTGEYKLIDLSSLSKNEFNKIDYIDNKFVGDGAIYLNSDLDDMRKKNKN